MMRDGSRVVRTGFTSDGFGRPARLQSAIRNSPTASAGDRHQDDVSPAGVVGVRTDDDRRTLLGRPRWSVKGNGTSTTSPKL
jgi:hypothetical protein